MPKSTYTRLIDTRPDGTQTTSGNAKVATSTLHGSLSGLTSHDHTQYYLATAFATEGGGPAANGPAVLDANGHWPISMMGGVSGVVTCSNAVLHIANGLIVAIHYNAGVKPPAAQSTMVLGALMGAVYNDSVYKEARDVP